MSNTPRVPKFGSQVHWPVHNPVMGPNRWVRLDKTFSLLVPLLHLLKVYFIFNYMCPVCVRALINAHAERRQRRRIPLELEF